MLTDNIRFEFNLVIPDNYEQIEGMVGYPIIINDKPIGVITESELDDSKLFYKCKGVIWDKFIKPEFLSGETLTAVGIKIE